MSVTFQRPAGETLVGSYTIAGVPCSVTADAAILELVDDAYGAYRTAHPESSPLTFVVSRRPEGLIVIDSNGLERPCGDQGEATLVAIEQVARCVTGELAGRGIYATHAAALVHSGTSVLISGRSGSGKTTLALALVARGLRILSDELALSAPDGRTILPYRRGLHVRPGTPELIEQLALMADRPFHPLSGGFQWTLRVDELERAFPSCLAEPAPLRHVVLLEPRHPSQASTLEPVAAGVVAVELLRATTAAATDLDGALRQMTRLVDDARCVRLHSGRLESSVELLLGWLANEDDRGRA